MAAPALVIARLTKCWKTLNIQQSVVLKVLSHHYTRAEKTQGLNCPCSQNVCYYQEVNEKLYSQNLSAQWKHSTTVSLKLQQIMSTEPFQY